ncbi:MAG: TonB-dependent receptor [Asticcacaulis sp.]
MATTTICGAVMSTMAGLAVVTATLAPTSALAQDYTTGAVTGTVADSNGKAIPSAVVTVTSKALGATVTTKTSASGSFSVGNLVPGTYDITVTADGFEAVTSYGVDVVASKTANTGFTVYASGTPTEVVVKGTRKKLAFSAATTGVTVDVDQLSKDVPIEHNLTSIIRLSPGTVQGSSAFGNLASIGGSSVAENAYYVDGLNVTDFNHYLGSSVVPFEMYKTVEVKNGGYSAEFGRATGGVTNATTKSGSNEFKGELTVNYAPNTWTSKSTQRYSNDAQFDTSDDTDYVAQLSGPIFKDKLFFYAIVKKYDNTATSHSTDHADPDFSLHDTGTESEDINKSTFYGGKLDWNITEAQHLALTYFDNTETGTQNQYTYDAQTGERTGTVGTNLFYYGDPSYVFHYTNRFSNFLSMSLEYGEDNDKSENDPSPTAGSLAQDGTVGQVVCHSLYCNPQRTSTRDFPDRTNRKFYRADFDLYFSLLGDHHVRFGYDREDNTLAHISTRTGPGGSGLANSEDLTRAYIYRTCSTSARCKAPGTGGGLGLTSTSSYVELNHYDSGGGFTSQNDALYIEDEWKITPKLTLGIGIRDDNFNNFTGDGSQYVKLHDNIAPRVYFNYDVQGNGRSRLYGSVGSYFLPIAGNTAFRQGAAELYYQEYWTFTGVNADGTPILGQQLTGWTGSQACPAKITSGSATAGTLGCVVTGQGLVNDPSSALSLNLQATKEDEVISATSKSSATSGLSVSTIPTAIWLRPPKTRRSTVRSMLTAPNMASRVVPPSGVAIPST